MGKRSAFKRVAKDFYPTPRKAIEPLIPFLNGTNRFAEPCAGKGDLVRHLEALRMECIYMGDLRSGRNALSAEAYGRGKYAIITNPPHTRKIMHELILHFQNIAPTWLLIDLDWASNEHAVPYLKRCSDIVVIGRVKWFPNTEHVGKENYMWARFWREHRGATKFHNRRGLP